MTTCLVGPANYPRADHDEPSNCSPSPVKHENICPPYVNTSPRRSLFLSDHHHHFPPVKRRLTTTFLAPQLAMVADTLLFPHTYAISFMPFMLLILISSRRGLPRNRFQPSAICGLFNSHTQNIVWQIRSDLVRQCCPFLELS